MRPSLRGKKLIVNQTLLSRLWCIGKILTIQKYIKKEIEKRIFDFLWNRKKIEPPRLLAQLSIWRSGLDIETQLKSLKIKWILRLLNPTNALRKDLMLYQLILILIYNQGLALLRQKQILRSTK